MPVAVTPRVLWQGPTSWIDVEHESTLGKAHSYIGPLPTRVLSPRLTTAVGASASQIIEQACEQVGATIAGHPEVCSRCARTLMRSALGSPDDAAAVITGAKPGDHERYAKVWRAMGKKIETIQGAMARLRTEAASGRLLTPPARQLVGSSFISKDSDALDASSRAAAGRQERTLGDPALRHYYQQGGAPLKAGQWEDYKLCACGDPNDAKSIPTMIAEENPTPPPTVVAGVLLEHDHTGGCGCSAAPRSP